MFLNDEDIKLYKFVKSQLSEELNMNIDIDEDFVVTGSTGNDIIKEAYIIRFYPEDATVEWVEDKIISQMNKFLFENGIEMTRSTVILRDVCLGRIRYGIVYTCDDL